MRFLRLGFVAVLIFLCSQPGRGAPASFTEPADADHAMATFSMYCYWTGEATLGRVDGVIASRIGHWGGSEIVQVDYDPDRTDLAALVDALRRQRSFYSVVVRDAAEERRASVLVDADAVTRQGGNPRFIASKYTLSRRYPELVALDLSEQQAVTLNSWSYFGGKMPDILTEEQKKRLAAR